MTEPLLLTQRQSLAVLTTALLAVVLIARPAHAGFETVYSDDFEARTAGAFGWTYPDQSLYAKIEDQDSAWVAWPGRFAGAVVANPGFLPGGSGNTSTKFLQMGMAGGAGTDGNLYFPRLFNGVNGTTPVGSDATKARVSMDVYKFSGTPTQLDFILGDYPNPPVTYDYYNHPGPGFEIGPDGSGTINAFYAGGGAYGNPLTVVSTGSNFVPGFDHWHKNFDPGLGGGWHHIEIDMTVDPSTLDGFGDMSLYTTWTIDGVLQFSGPAFDAMGRNFSAGTPQPGSGGNNVYPGVFSKINVSQTDGGGLGLRSAEIYGEALTFLDNITIIRGFNESNAELVPEPSTFVLAGLGLVGLGCVALRKKFRHV